MATVYTKALSVVLQASPFPLIAKRIIKASGLKRFLVLEKTRDGLLSKSLVTQSAYKRTLTAKIGYISRLKYKTIFLQVSNNAQTTLSAAITDVAATSISVASSSLFPVPGNPFNATIDSEILTVTGVSDTTWTVVRGAEGTVAATHSSGAVVVLNITAKEISNLNSAVNTIESSLTNSVYTHNLLTTGTHGAGSNTIATTNLMPNRNIIINGAMNIWQRGTTAQTAPAANSYFADRWQAAWVLNHGVFNLEQSTDVPTVSQAGMKFPYSTKVVVTTIESDSDFATHTGDALSFHNHIEGYDIQRFMGQVCTISFWIKSSVTGTYSVGFQNTGSDYSYPASYTVNAANTWEKKTCTLTFADGSTGTWNYTNGAGSNVIFSLASGAGSMGTANQWATGSKPTATGHVNILSSTDNVLYLTGVQLELGAVATPFEFRPYQQELALCQRYCQQLQPYFNTTSADGFFFAIKYLTNCIASQGMTLSVPMRAAPTLVNNDLTTWDADGTPAVGNVSFYDVVHAGWVTIVGALTVAITRTSNTKFTLQCTAATSFSGTDGDIGALHLTSVAVLSAEL